MKKTLYGAHGTCETYANSIYAEGFKKNEGRHGIGVYLWQVDKNDEYSWKNINDLTECYLKDTDYRRNVSNPTHVLLRCQIDVLDDNFYDFECHEHTALFATYRKHFEQNYSLENVQKELDRSDSSNQRGSNKSKKEKELATKVYNGFFAMLEEYLDKPLDIYVYFVKAQKPKSYKSMTSIMVGYTVGCYVVKKPSIITIIKKDVL